MEFIEEMQNFLASFGVTDNLVTIILTIVGYLVIYFRTGSKYLSKKLNLNSTKVDVDLSSYDVFYKDKKINFKDLTFKKKEV